VVIREAQDYGLSLGATKLTKILVFSDVKAMESLKPSITGRPAVKAPYGPVPAAYESALETLKATRRISTSPIVSLASPDYGRFNPFELNVLKTMTYDFCFSRTAGELTRMSRNEMWERLSVGEALPLSSYLPQEEVPMSALEIQDLMSEPGPGVSSSS
jgi:hypothetical protein